MPEQKCHYCPTVPAPDEGTHWNSRRLCEQCSITVADVCWSLPDLMDRDNPLEIPGVGRVVLTNPRQARRILEENEDEISMAMQEAGYAKLREILRAEIDSNAVKFKVVEES